jgi:hypothetical protein
VAGVTVVPEEFLMVVTSVVLVKATLGPRKPWVEEFTSNLAEGSGDVVPTLTWALAATDMRAATTKEENCFINDGLKRFRACLIIRALEPKKA